jgi:CheY-like chemotaxis protein
MEFLRFERLDRVLRLFVNDNTIVKRTVLVVEDDFDSGEMIVHILSTAGYRVHLTRNRDEAAAAFNENPYEFIILDIKMPGMTIEEFLDKVSPKNPCVIVISGIADVQAEAGRLEVDGWLWKPFDSERLIRTLQDLRPHPKPE